MKISLIGFLIKNPEKVIVIKCVSHRSKTKICLEIEIFSKISETIHQKDFLKIKKDFSFQNHFFNFIQKVFDFILFQFHF
jgi:hypothetical protein